MMNFNNDLIVYIKKKLVIGKEGQSLTELWKSSAPELYKSTMIHGFPNLFMLLGPYTLTGHISVVLMAEM